MGELSLICSQPQWAKTQLQQGSGLVLKTPVPTIGLGWAVYVLVLVRLTAGEVQLPYTAGSHEPLLLSFTLSPLWK